MLIINFIPIVGLKPLLKKTFQLIILTSVCSFSTNVWSTSILLLGDSLSASRGMQQKEGWVSLLNQQFKQQNHDLKIINASISGETTGGGLARLPTILTKESADYLLIELGGNDGLRGFKPSLIKNNLLQIIKLAQAKNITVLLMDIRIPPNYGVRYNNLFNKIFDEIAKKSKITLLPFFIKKIALQPTLMQDDGIHPNKKAQPQIAEIMFEHLKGLEQNQ
jgi:acyl-CoA thioesterase I